MRVLISGATGLIGRQIGSELCRRGHEVVVFSRRKEGVRETLPFPCAVKEWNPLQQEFEDPGAIDAIVNLAGSPVAESRWTEEIKKSLFDSRVLGTRLLVQLATLKGIKVFVNASAIGFYGNRGEEWLEESSKSGDDFLSTVCKAWESELFESKFPARKCAIRIGVVLARHGGALDRMLPIFLNGGGGPLGNGRQFMSWIHIEDIVNIFCDAVENQKYQGVINAVAPEPVTNRVFTQELARTLEIPAIIPAPTLAIQAVFGEMANVVLGSQRVRSKKLQDLGYDFRFSNLKEALEDVAGVLKGGVRVIETSQYLDHPLEQVWPFFSSEKNLEDITPETLKFHVVGMSTPVIQKGTLIDYKLKIHGVPSGWQTEIKEWDPPHQFVDFQKKGPYSLWHHRHKFESLGRGTLMTDQVRYKLPLGILGRMVAGALVSKDVNSIFDFRMKKMLQVFPFKD